MLERGENIYGVNNGAVICDWYCSVCHALVLKETSARDPRVRDANLFCDDCTAASAAAERSANTLVALVESSSADGWRLILGLGGNYALRDMLWAFHRNHVVPSKLRYLLRTLAARGVALPDPFAAEATAQRRQRPFS